MDEPQEEFIGDPRDVAGRVPVDIDHGKEVPPRFREESYQQEKS